MTVQANTPIDRLIQPAIKKAAKSTSYFRKSEAVRTVLTNPKVVELLTDLRNRHGGWQIDQLVIRCIDAKVAQELQRRDANGIRVYECYAAGERERRWLPLRAMTRDQLRAVMQATRTQARSLTLKGEGYQIFLDELEKLSPTAVVNDVYDRVVPKIQAYRSA
ncbi:MAG: hypothetical protein WAL35_01615 [Acidimicrobiales bacterium]